VAVRDGGVGRAGVNPRRLDRDTLEQALRSNGGNIQHTAEQLGISRRTLMKKMDDLGFARARR
jgi:DNA-binding NtrC family response regulator